MLGKIHTRRTSQHGKRIQEARTDTSQVSTRPVYDLRSNRSLHFSFLSPSSNICLVSQQYADAFRVLFRGGSNKQAASIILSSGNSNYTPAPSLGLGRTNAQSKPPKLNLKASDSTKPELQLPNCPPARLQLQKLAAAGVPRPLFS